MESRDWDKTRRRRVSLKAASGRLLAGAQCVCLAARPAPMLRLRPNAKPEAERLRIMSVLQAFRLATIPPRVRSTSNTSGNTNPALPSSSEGLCESQGGTWNGVTCDYSSLCALPLGTYDPDTGNCDYTNLYIAVGGAVLLLLLLELFSGGAIGEEL